MGSRLGGAPAAPPQHQTGSCKRERCHLHMQIEWHGCPVAGQVSRWSREHVHSANTPNDNNKQHAQLQKQCRSNNNPLETCHDESLGGSYRRPSLHRLFAPHRLGLLLAPQGHELRQPEHGDAQHEARRDPRQDVELDAALGGEADAGALVVDLAHALAARDGDDDAPDEARQAAQRAEDEVGEHDGRPARQQEGRRVGEHGEPAEAHGQRVEDEEPQQRVVEHVKLVLHAVGPVDVGEVELERADAEPVVEHAGEVEGGRLELTGRRRAGAVGHREGHILGRGTGRVAALARVHDVQRVPLRDAQLVGQLIGGVARNIVDLVLGGVLLIVEPALDAAKDAVVAIATIVGLVRLAEDVVPDHGRV
ncbi:hypothetical protein VFPFJ_00859 [Purpureocillium lilacinum]|uniref:Uncharacterized protein n=1 Tax=Purpureocillium lilacinum TaxID=33203 RepID=A0A179HZH9_PURLI|nr:hypothetical protein VFPFJ_00859 [Purpureocillium lilacinum]OAQ94750.1 hypothetical protein VFPFJ_00859 [Purpureocillium lilacinum]